MRMYNINNNLNNQMWILELRSTVAKAKNSVGKFNIRFKQEKRIHVIRKYTDWTTEGKKMWKYKKEVKVYVCWTYISKYEFEIM